VLFPLLVTRATSLSALSRHKLSSAGPSWITVKYEGSRSGVQSVATYSMMIIMRFPKEHKARVRERIVRAAARKLRGAGLDLRRPNSGCVVAALGSDGWRKGKKVRAAFADVAEGLARLVDEKLGPVAQGDAISDRALAVTAQMVGAVVLGRLVDDPVLAERIMSAGREAALRI
jgi:hypothetical protein